jgi:hypothetical protein
LRFHLRKRLDYKFSTVVHSSNHEIEGNPCAIS